MLRRRIVLPCLLLVVGAMGAVAIQTSMIEA